MLSREIMAAALLGVLWVTAILLAVAAFQDVRELLRRRRAFRPLGVGEAGEGMIDGGVVTRAEPGKLATLTVEQIGRAQDGAVLSLVYGDRRYASRVAGGLLESARGEVKVEAAEGDAAEVWTTEVERERALACPGEAAFDDAYAGAKKARGHVREVTLSVGAGDRVFVAGVVQRDGDAWTVRAPEGRALVVATFDPRAFCTKHVAKMTAFVALELAFCAGATRLALWPPAFGPVSVGGAVLGLVFFFLATPIGASIRQQARVPSRAVMRTTWTSPSRRAAAVKATA
jgi:hypothetical protein